MKIVSLVSCFLLTILVILLLSMTAQATEYREINTEVNASNVSKHIENGDDIYLDNCRIIGELNVSNMKLETINDPIFIENLIILGNHNNIIESKISIIDSVFENGLYFSNTLFKAPVTFTGSTFDGPADFYRSTFNSSATFTGSIFSDSANFYESNFNGPADFSTFIKAGQIHIYSVKKGQIEDVARTEFHEGADFSESNFNNYVRFNGVKFYRDVCFTRSNFDSSTDFTKSTFNGPANFTKSNFCDPVDFYESTFNDSASFFETDFNSSYLKGPKEFKKIITSEEKTCNLFREFYKNEARYTDADNIYYDYRTTVMNSEKITSLSKWSDFLIFITCGYGVRPFRSFFMGGIIIGLFSIIYWQGSGIYRFSDIDEKKSKVSYLDALLFSIREFVTVGSADWYPRDNFRILVTLEGLLGWIMLGIFMATLTTVMIRL